MVVAFKIQLLIKHMKNNNFFFIIIKIKFEFAKYLVGNETVMFIHCV